MNLADDEKGYSAYRMALSQGDKERLSLREREKIKGSSPTTLKTTNKLKSPIGNTSFTTHTIISHGFGGGDHY